MLNVTFHGVRASPPVPGKCTRRYGAHTSCVALEVPKRRPILFDLGTGLVAWAATMAGDPRLPAHALLSRVDLDRVRGLAQLAVPAEIDVYGPRPQGRRLGEQVGDLLGPALAAGHPAALRFVSVEDEELVVGEAKVMVRTMSAAAASNGYRVEWEGVAVAYVSGQRATPAVDAVAQEVLELADGVDLLVHDAQGVTPVEADRGPDERSTVDYAVLVAREAGARCLALFRHHPTQDDDEIDRLLAGARRTAERLGVDEVIAAAEGTTVSFER